MVIDTIYQNKPDTVVIVANVIPWFNDTRDSSLPDSIRMLGTELQELVRRSSNPLISIADVRTGFSEDMMQADLIHPNDDGDAHIANAIFNTTTQIVFADRVCVPHRTEALAHALGTRYCLKGLLFAESPVDETGCIDIFNVGTSNLSNNAADLTVE